MSTSLSYAIKFVGDMDRAVQFHTNTLGLKLRFRSPGWSEFDTGSTTLALHLASAENPAGTCQLGLRVPDIERFYSEKVSQGVQFTCPPTELHGQRIARFKDVEGSEYSVSGP